MVSRRSSLVALTAGLGLLSVGGQALAGAQLEEPLAVRRLWDASPRLQLV